MQISIHQKNAIWLGLEKVFKMLLTAFTSFYVAKAIGVENFGALSYIISLVLVISEIANFGMDSLLIKAIAEQPQSKQALVFMGIKVKFVMSIVLGALLYSTILNGKISEIETRILIPATIILILTGLQVFEFYFLAESESRYTAKSLFIAGLICNFGKLVAVWKGEGVVIVAWITALEYFLAYSLIVLSYFKYRKKDEKPLHKSTLKKLIRDALPLLVGSISVSLYMRVDQIMLRNLLSLKEVGLYSASVKLVESFYFIPIVITSSYLIKWTSLYSKEEDYLNSVRKVTSFLMVVAILISLFFLVFGESIIELLFGNEYSKSYEILKIYSLSPIFVFLGVVTSKVLIIKNQQKYLLYSSLFGGGLNIILNSIFIPKFGSVGAAWATIIGHSFTSIIFYIFFQDTREMVYFFLKTILPHSILKNTLKLINDART